ncbi:MAG: glycosyltransferase family 2 protein [Bacteroidales bacterium]|nr:glycosyltransferase family 2 protein [Bacteroidales bacterium]
MKVAVVILNWNTEGFLRDFLPGLLQSVRNVEGAEVIVADNASTDGSMTVMKEMFPQVRTIAFEKNIGFTGGYNRAFEQIDSEYFVLINSDIEVPEDWLGPLVDWMDTHPECGACAPKLHSWQEREKFEYAGAAGGYIDLFGYPFCRGRILNRLETDKGQYDTPADVFWATGACLMVRSSLYRRLGGLDDRFFAHMEEIDLCWRMQLEGFEVTVVPESVVYHLGGGTLPASSPFKLFLNYRNNLLMLSNNLGKTFALQALKDGACRDRAAAKGYRKARRRIAFRKCLDIMSAGVYLMTLNTESFKAVLKAHKEYGKLALSPSEAEIRKYLEDYGGKSSVRGIYKKWIILASMLKGDKIFSSVKEQDFYM